MCTGGYVKLKVVNYKKEVLSPVSKSVELSISRIKKNIL